MIWQISHMIREIQVTICEYQVKIAPDLISSDRVQSKIWLAITAIHQILNDFWARQPVVGTGYEGIGQGRSELSANNSRSIIST